MPDYPPPFQVLRLDHVVLAVSDLQRAEAFYSRLLGAHVERRLENPKLVQLRTGDSLLDLVPGAPDPAHPNMAHYCFRIDPFDEAAIHAHLQSLGVTPENSGERYGADGHGPSIYLRDPDHNQIELKGPPVRRLDGTPIP
jgi:catechol 2,3-dioxygenase-like lactoylglutathione lyase family enzyme